MSVIYRSATPSELIRLLPSLDQQFVYDKHRKLSLARRFPSTFCLANSKNIFICEENGVILSSLAVKRFEWQNDDQIWSGAMLGAVHTDPAQRGKGLASQLLHWVAQELQKDSVDFAVLWTAQPEFYARLDWILIDDGVLGKITDSTKASKSNCIAGMAGSVFTEQFDMEDARLRLLSAMVVRQPQDYLQIPIPSENIEVLWSKGEHKTFAYALLGNVDNTGIIYEMVGDEQCLPALFSQITSRYSNILVNDCKGSESHSWLTQHASITWQDKPLAMWLLLSDELKMSHIKSWYIPYFDRI